MGAINDGMSGVEQLDNTGEGGDIVGGDSSEGEGEEEEREEGRR